MRSGTAKRARLTKAKASALASACRPRCSSRGSGRRRHSKRRGRRAQSPRTRAPAAYEIAPPARLLDLFEQGLGVVLLLGFLAGSDPSFVTSGVPSASPRATCASALVTSAVDSSSSNTMTVGCASIIVRSALVCLGRPRRPRRLAAPAANAFSASAFSSAAAPPSVCLFLLLGHLRSAGRQRVGFGPRHLLRPLLCSGRRGRFLPGRQLLGSSLRLRPKRQTLRRLSGPQSRRVAFRLDRSQPRLTTSRRRAPPSPPPACVCASRAPPPSVAAESDEEQRRWEGWSGGRGGA